MQKIDEKDCDILAKRTAARRNLNGPLVGDFVIMPNGEMKRFTRDNGNTIQITSNIGNESFYLEESGTAIVVLWILEFQKRIFFSQKKLKWELYGSFIIIFGKLIMVSLLK